MLQQTTILEGQLRVSEVMSRKPLTVPLGTPLEHVARLLAEGHSRHVLVTDHNGSLVGVVSDHDLLCHWAPWQGDGPKPLNGKTVESVMVTKFVAGTPDANAQDLAAALVDGAIECLPILEGGKLVGVMTSSDLLLSWNRMHPVFRQAGTDALTGLANRGTFDRRLAEELERSLRQQVALALILFDVDEFKRINDTCGHLTGDAVLRTIAVSLSRHLRVYDVLARFGGDEFAAICPGCDLQEIQVPIQRVQHGINRLSVPLDNERRGVTLSIGTAALRNRAGNVTPAQLIGAADECLYRAKADGGSRSCAVELGEGWKPLFPVPRASLDLHLGTQPMEHGSADAGF